MPKRGLTGTGTEVKVNKSALKYVKSFAGLGGTPESLDMTCLTDRQKKSANGLVDPGNPEIIFYFDNSDADSDYRKLKAIEDAGEPVDIEVILPPSDGTTFKSTAMVSVSIDGAVEGGQLIMGKASLALQDDWAVTNPV